MVRDDVIGFLRDPAAFAHGVTPDARDDWLAGLSFAREAIASSASEHALREAQETGWTGIASHRCALILGPPGTGKTFALSWMALGWIEGRRAAGRPCRVLVTGFTRNAIINLLEAVAKRSVHAKGPLALHWLGKAPDQALPDAVDVIGVKALGRALDGEYVVVGATSWQLHQAIVKGRPAGTVGPTAPLFDLVCIDEASQMVVGQGLMSLAGLAPGGRVLVAGDDNQLAPVRETHERELDGRRLGTSLYGFLAHAGVPEFPLTETFRLNALLADYPARAFYEGRYISAGSARSRRLDLRPGWEAGLPAWVRHALDPDNPVCVLLYDGPLCGTSNPFEADRVVELVEQLYRCTPPPEGDEALSPTAFWQARVAVVSPHRAQNALIRQRLRARGHGEGCVVETVDRIQGRERDAIVASYTVSDPEFAQIEAGFIFNPERFNVTVTRARTKLVLLVSRDLLDVMPEDEALFEQSQVLRGYVFETVEVGTWAVRGPQGPVSVTVRVRRFDDAPPLDDIDAIAEQGEVAEAPEPDEAELSAALRELLDAVRRLSAENTRYRNTADYKLKDALSRPIDEIRQGLLALQAAGFVDLDVRSGPYGPFWTVRPRMSPRRPHACTAEAVEAHVEAVIDEVRGGNHFSPFYTLVRPFFCWLDASGTDRLEPLLDALVEAGRLRWGEHGGQKTVDRAAPVAVGAPEPAAAPALPPAPGDEDFVVLNALEDIEQRRIDFGIFDSWVEPRTLADALGCDVNALAGPLGRLAADGWLMRVEDEHRTRLRSRAAELAREVRYVKQRFCADDARRRPFLVRSAKVAFRGREKPERDHRSSETFDALRAVFAGDAEALRVIDATAAMLAARWGDADPRLAGFQARALRAILPAWFGRGEPRAFVITADTGSGKTEAAGLPLIMAAAIDRLRGLRGTRAVLVYPRIRLANNQAQRLVGYLAALAAEEGMPAVTIGVTNSDVERHFDERAPGGRWQKSTRSRPFSLFGCPASGCDGTLDLRPSASYMQPDSLVCATCGWRYGGWVGSKRGLGQMAAQIFVTTTESLHSWLHSQHRTRLFGDHADLGAPRALLADEIHLYSHIQGAQVGYALRRLLARMRINSARPEDAPLAIGMSATLGEATRVWETLCGLPSGSACLLAPREGERKPNPRAREYFYFVQPEVESRGKAVAGASTTIQALMCLAHGMRRRTGDRGGYRALAFLDSIDKVKRLHGDYADAERKGLAGLRIGRKDVPPCCGQPMACGRFADGECWSFAALDGHQVGADGARQPGRPLKVTRTPVFSGAKDEVDDMIRTSDVVFSTSSLEVGFDDPDMSLVYQHYAPLNAASFVQRKGRGGRGADDRPVTGVTLSIYSPRDTWFFHRPTRMLDAAHFRVPLNMGNVFVRSGQLIAVLLDAAVRRRRGQPPGDTALTPADFADAARLAAYVFGDGDVPDAQRIERWWNEVRPQIRSEGKSGLAEWIADIREAPTRLFDTINLPALTVCHADDQGRLEEKKEDIALALLACAPGTATRRYAMRITHWVEPADGYAPWGAIRATDAHDDFEPVEVPEGAGPEARVAALRRELPRYLHLDFADVEPKVVRPHTLHLEQLGRFDGSGWGAYRTFDAQTGQISKQGTGYPINPKSEGRLDGFILCAADQRRGEAHRIPALEPLTTELYAFRGRSADGQTGLTVSRVYWGADCRLVVDVGEYQRKEYVFTQTFVEPGSAAVRRDTGEGRPRVQLYGYRLRTEGVRLRLDGAWLDAFVDDTVAALDATPEGRWLRGQYFRFLMLSRAPSFGLGRYQARELVDLLVTARAFAEEEEALRRLLRRWDGTRLAELLERTFRRHASQHPLLTPQRVEALVEHLRDVDALDEHLRGAIADCGDADGFRGYVRSLVVHGLAVRLQQLFVRHGAGDPRRILFHVRLPVQFGEDADDAIVICENGEHGDGTTRAFLEQLEAAFAELDEGLLSACINAREDAVLERILGDEALVERWSAIDPTDEAAVRGLAEALGLDVDDAAGGAQAVVQAAVRLLTGSEVLEGERYTYLQLQREVHAARVDLGERMDREPSAWELVSHVVGLAGADDPRVPSWTRLLACYRSFPDAPDEADEATSAEARLADQVHRLSARLCVDGCQACLHTGSPLFPPQLTDATVSRRLLARLEAALGWHARGRRSLRGRP